LPANMGRREGACQAESEAGDKGGQVRARLADQSKGHVGECLADGSETTTLIRWSEGWEVTHSADPAFAAIRLDIGRGVSL
jgi:hypothetical protein